MLARFKINAVDANYTDSLVREMMKDRLPLLRLRSKETPPPLDEQQQPIGRIVPREWQRPSRKHCFYALKELQNHPQRHLFAPRTPGSPYDLETIRHKLFEGKYDMVGRDCVSPDFECDVVSGGRRLIVCLGGVICCCLS